MDFSSLMDKLIFKYNSNTSNPLSLDRTLGTVATVSITLGVYRILSAVSASQSDSKRKLSMGEVIELIKLCLGSLFLGNSKAFTNGEGQSGWSWRNKNGAKSVSSTSAHCRELKRLEGSCHCQSVRFVLKAPTKIVARQDNRGKICHPYYSTTAEKFELLCGTKYLSVYYVNLTPQSFSDRDRNRPHGQSSDPDRNRDEVIIAAHTFCSRCGVHIFRAPNSRTDQLDVNVDCLEDKCSVVEIVVEKEKKGMDIWSGKPSKNGVPLNRNSNAEQLNGGDVQGEDEISVSQVDCPHPELIQLILTKHQCKTGTPTTSATTSSTALLQVADSEDDGFSYDDNSTLRSSQSTLTGRISYQNNALYRTTSSSLSVSAADNMSVGDWEMGSSSVKSLPLRNTGRVLDDGISLPSMPFPKNVESRQSMVNNPLPPSAVLKDRLKHYMKKHHVSSSKSNSFRQETIEENRSFR